MSGDGSFVEKHNVHVDVSRFHRVLTIRMRTGSCNTRSGDQVYFSTAFGEFSLFNQFNCIMPLFTRHDFRTTLLFYDGSFDKKSCISHFRVTQLDANSVVQWSCDSRDIKISNIWHYSRYGLNPITLMLPVN